MEEVIGTSFLSSIPRGLLFYNYSLVKVWDSHSGKLQHTLSGHTEEIEVSNLKCLSNNCGT